MSRDGINEDEKEGGKEGARKDEKEWQQQQQ